MSGMNGCYMQIQLKGAQDVFLMAPNGVSFFVANYRRHTNFAYCEQDQASTSTPALGNNNIQVNIEKNGDLLHHCYVNATFDAIIPSTPSEYSSGDSYVSWINGLGYAMISDVSFMAAAKTYDSMNGRFMFMRECMSKPLGRQLRQAVGYYGTRLDRAIASQQVQELNVPLQFSFCKYPQQMLPTVGLQWTDLKFVFSLASQSSLLYTYGSGYPSGYTTGGLLDFHLVMQFFYLDLPEKMHFLQDKIQMIFVQHQSLGVESWTTSTSLRKRIDISFSHPVIDLTWAPYYGAATTSDWNKELCFDGVSYNAFSGASTVVQEPYKDMTMFFANNQRTPTLSAAYLRQIPHYQSSECVPDESLGQRIGNYSFAMKNDNTIQPCGSSNFSSYERARMDFGLWDSADSSGYIYPTTDTWKTNCSIEIHARNFNLMKKSIGQLSLRWGS